MHPNPISFQRRMHPELAPTLIAALNPEAVDADSPGVRIARAMIEDACTAAVTDIHIEPYREGAHVRFRIDGSVRDICHLTTQQGRILANQIKAHSGMDPVVRFTPTETRTRFESKAGSVDLRISVAPALDRDTIAIRLLYAHRLERCLSELGLSEANLPAQLRPRRSSHRSEKLAA